MKAVILAGGKGTRLKPYTTVIPKPLVPVGEKAIIEILMNRLRKSGVDEVYICLNHFAELIIAFLGNGTKFGVKINYIIEDQPLGTVAPVKLIHDLPENFLVMNGDLLTNLDFRILFDRHVASNALLTISAYKRTTRIDFGVIDVDQTTDMAIGFHEKPVYDFEVSMGVYAMNRKVLDLVPDRTPFGFDNLMFTMFEQKKEILVFRFDGYWLDIGRPDDYERANDDYEKLKDIF